MMKLRWLAVTIATGVVALLWMFGSGHVDRTVVKRFVGLSPATEVATKDKAKPICSLVIGPAGRCIPHVQKIMLEYDNWHSGHLIAYALAYNQTRGVVRDIADSASQVVRDVAGATYADCDRHRLQRDLQGRT